MTVIDRDAVYSAPEAAKLLHVTLKVLRRLPIPCSPLTRRTVLYRGGDLDAYLTRVRVGKSLRRVG